MMVGKWSDYVLNDDHDNTEITRSCLINTINAFKDSDVKIWIMRQVPESDWDVPFILASSVVYHHSIPEKIGIPKIKYKEANNIQNQIFNGLSTKFTRVNILDPTYLFMGSDNTYRVEKNGKSLYSDKQHLSIAGAIELRPLFEPIFRKEIQKNTFIQSR